MRLRARARPHLQVSIPSKVEGLKASPERRPRKRGAESKPLDPARGHELAQWVLDELGTPALVPLEGS